MLLSLILGFLVALAGLGYLIFLWPQLGRSRPPASPLYFVTSAIVLTFAILIKTVARAPIEMARRNSSADSGAGACD